VRKMNVEGEIEEFVENGRKVTEKTMEESMQ
jgi:hypothetical protein